MVAGVAGTRHQRHDTGRAASRTEIPVAGVVVWGLSRGEHLMVDQLLRGQAGGSADLPVPRHSPSRWILLSSEDLTATPKKSASVTRVGSSSSTGTKFQKASLPSLAALWHRGTRFGSGAREHGVLCNHQSSPRCQPADRTSSASPALLTLRQAADYLAVSYWTVRSWADAGKLPVVRLPGDGRLVRVERTELERLIVVSRA